MFVSKIDTGGYENGRINAGTSQKSQMYRG